MKNRNNMQGAQNRIPSGMFRSVEKYTVTTPAFRKEFYFCALIHFFVYLCANIKAINNAKIY